MTDIVYSDNALKDLERLFAFLVDENPDAAIRAADAITSAVEILGAHPMVGRRVSGEIRELVVSFGKSGYLALYRFVAVLDQVRVLAIRHQRELDYQE